MQDKNKISIPQELSEIVRESSGEMSRVNFTRNFQVILKMLF
jgi:hypothetical protein